MLTLVAVLALSQVTPPPLPPPDAPVAEGARLNTAGRKAGFFSAPRVEPLAVVGRIGMGTLFGSIAGGTLAFGVTTLGIILSTLGSIAPLIVAVPISVAFLGLGTALGAAMFGNDYGRDLGDSIIVSMACSLVAIVLPLVLYFTVPLQVMFPVLVASLLLPAAVTPLLVQTLKREEAPVPTIALATF